MVNKSEKETETVRSSFYYKPKKVSSVIPAKRKLVKRLIFDHFVSYLVTLCSPSCSVSVMYNSGIHGGYNNNSGEAGGGDGGNTKSHQIYPLE
uniref:Uncharacterized protein n=1 Tax=Chenopodium quinoa TaxID=63459 RepID=A0A803NE77_CHEQI